MMRAATRLLVGLALAGALCLQAPCARADLNVSQQSLAREFFMRHANGMAYAAHPILASAGSSANVEPAADGVRITITYASHDETRLSFYVSDDGALGTVQVERDTAVPVAFAGIDLGKQLVINVLVAQLNSKDGSKLRSALQGLIRLGGQQVGSKDIVTAALKHLWNEEGYAARFRGEESLPPPPREDSDVPAAQTPAPPPIVPSPTPPAPAPWNGPSEESPPMGGDAPPPDYAAPPDVAEAPYAPRADVDEYSAGEAYAHASRVHDGFYWRLSAGFGGTSVDFDDKDVSGRHVEGNGATPGFELLFGGSPRRGFVIGGGVLGQAGNLELERGAQRAAARGVVVALAGPFIDAFPSPSKGFHFGGLLGLAVVGVKDTGDSLQTSSGAGAAAWLGYDFWIADEWSLGPALRFTGTFSEAGEGDEPELSVATGSAMLSLTALYH